MPLHSAVRTLSHFHFTGDDEIFLYDSTDTIQLTDNDYEDQHPQINDAGYVVWHGYEGGGGCFIDSLSYK